MIFEKIQLEQDERIISLVRRHWFYLLKEGAFVVLLSLLPVLGYGMALLFIGDTSLISSYAPHLFFLYSFWLLINWMMLASIWTDYYLDVWCITNKRIIRIDQISLFYRKTGSFRLERMQDINVEINGILATFLDYGTIHLQTASADYEEFKATYLPKPQELKALILRAADEQMDRNSL